MKKQTWLRTPSIVIPAGWFDRRKSAVWSYPMEEQNLRTAREVHVHESFDRPRRTKEGRTKSVPMRSLGLSCRQVLWPKATDRDADDDDPQGCFFITDGIVKSSRRRAKPRSVMVGRIPQRLTSLPPGVVGQEILVSTDILRQVRQCSSRRPR